LPQAAAAALDDPPADETSWVDEPHQEWLEETPAMLAARDAVVPTSETAPRAIHENAVGESADETPDFAVAQPKLAHRLPTRTEAAAA
jgi:hypothetical protein